MNIETIGDLRKALEKFDDNTPLDFIELEPLSDEERKEHNTEFKEAIIPYEVVKVSDDVLVQENPKTGTKTKVVTIAIKEIELTLEEAQKLEKE